MICGSFGSPVYIMLNPFHLKRVVHLSISHSSAIISDLHNAFFKYFPSFSNENNKKGVRSVQDWENLAVILERNETAKKTLLSYKFLFFSYDSYFIFFFISFIRV